MPLGTYFIDRNQPELSSREASIVRKFHALYYNLWLKRSADTINLSWFGYRLAKCPLDLWIYQELLTRTRPDFVIETGTYHGGSALYFAMIMDLLGHGSIITIDIEAQPNRPEHPRITYITGSSVDPGIVQQVQTTVGTGRAMVVLDSDHTEAHVHKELTVYSPFVHKDDYLIVEDTNVNGHPIWPDFGPGPMEAVDRFLSQTDDFEIDRSCERFLLTMYPKGYLRRVKSKERN